jgi:hypothetical protein
MSGADQGPVPSLREFAAKRANTEDRQRLGREVTEILRVDKLDELQRRLREVVRCVALCNASRQYLCRCTIRLLAFLHRLPVRGTDWRRPHFSLASPY